MWEKLFDRIAEDYDQSVQETDHLGLFPYAGYDEILTEIANQVDKAKHLTEKRILDLGIGTGALYQKLNPNGCELVGIDVSAKMLDLARLRIPQANLIQRDFRKGLPEAIQKDKFDFIISTYALHHLTTPEFVGMIGRLVEMMAPFGKILIGDIMFANKIDHDQCKKKNSEYWDESETYEIFDDLIDLLDGKLALSFMKMSFCAGVLIIENFHDTALQIEDSLIKYTGNTAKWKSSQPQKKSE